MSNPSALVTCLLGGHVWSHTALQEGGGPAGQGAEPSFKKNKTEKEKLVGPRVVQSRRSTAEGKMMVTCIQKAGCPWLGLDQEDLRHEATRPVGAEKQKSSLAERRF